MSIDPASGTPLYQQVAAHIRAQIVSGQMPVGTRLQPHRQLAEHYGVSVITINKALSGLVSEGVLHSRVGRGTFVAVRPPASTDIPRTDHVFGFVLRDLNSPFFSLVAHAAQQRTDACGYGLLFSSSSNRADREDEQIARFRGLGAQGLIIVSMSRTYHPSNAIRALHRSDFPYVMVSYTEGDDVPFVGLDLDRAGYLVGEHLAAIGRRRFGFVGDKFGSRMFDIRGGGYQRGVEEAGFAVDPAFTFEYPNEGEWNDYRSGYEVGQHIATLDAKPDAMFLHNDLGALGFMDALAEAGIRVPDDIAIASIDDIERASRARVPLTTVRQPTALIGAMAVDTLLARLRGETPPVRQLLAPELVIRGSTAAASDPTVASTNPHPRALRSLKDHAAIPP